MPAFVPKLVCPPYHFDIKRNRQGYWIARDRGGLAGGTFLTRKDAVRFALFEAGGDSAHVHTYPEAKAARIDREHELRDRLAYAHGEDRAHLEHRLQEVHYQRQQCRGR